MAVLNNYMPGYLNYPAHTEPTICGLRDARTESPTAENTWSTRSRHSIGDAATAENDYAMPGCPSEAPPRTTARMPMFEDALAGKLKMLWIVGQNPAVTMPNLEADLRGDGEARDAGGPGDLGDGDRGVLAPPRRRSEVHLHRSDPAAGRVLHGEERHHQQFGRHGAVAPRGGEAAGAGQARRRDRGSGLPASARPGQGFERTRETRSSKKRSGPTPLPRMSCARSTGTRCATSRKPALRPATIVSKVGDLQPDGSTSAGAWIYAGVFANGGEPFEAPRLANRSGRSRRFIRASAGPGPTTCASSTTARRATGTASPIRDRSPSSGGTRRRSAGRDTTCPTSPSLTDGPDTPNGQRAFHLNRGRCRAPLRGGLLGPGRQKDPAGIRAMSPTCRKTVRCRKCTSRSRVQWRTSFTRR